MGHQVLVQLESIGITIVWSGVVAFHRLQSGRFGLSVCVFQKIRNVKVWTSTATAKTLTMLDIQVTGEGGDADPGFFNCEVCASPERPEVILQS